MSIYIFVVLKVKFLWLILHQAESNKNFNKNTNTINNDSKGLSNISPVNVYYYPLNNYSEFQRGFILQKLLNKNVLDTPNLELETTLRKEYSS